MNKFYATILLSFLASGLFAQNVFIFNNYGTSTAAVVGASNYHVSESIYTNAELGPQNFLTAGSAIQQLNFYVAATGTPGTIASSFKIYLKNVPAATTTFVSGAYSTTGYTLVYNGLYNASVTGWRGVTLSTPFVRTAGSNLSMLIERLDNTAHAGFYFLTSSGNATSSILTTSRRINTNTLPVSGTTSLTAVVSRPAIQLIHTFAIDAGLSDIFEPTVSCYVSPQTIGIEISNDGTSPIALGAASVTLKISGPNSFSGIKTNTKIIAPGATDTVRFTGININNAGDNIDTAYVNLAGDGTTYNDSLFSYTPTAPILTSYPMIEDAEGTLPVFSYLQIAAGTSQLWRLQTGAYSNADQTKPLNPHSGTHFFLFDSWSGSSSVDFVSRFYSNCIKMPSTVAPNPAPVTTISFWMSHDIIYPTDYDSLYLSVSTNKGLSWTRLFPGFRRPGIATDSTPIWKMETVNISAYNGQTIQIGFDGVSKYGNVIGLDDITINYTGVAPVSLLQFDAKRSGPINNLSWNTSQEVNTRGFEIERSTDGKNFVKIGYVTAAGNSNTNRNYFYTDASPSKGINYYRLRMEDNDNAYKYSQIRSVKNLGVAEVTIAPNPVQNTMNLMIDAENTEKSTLVITDIAGKMVYKNSLSVIAGTNTFHIPVSNLTTGTYIVTIQLSGETIIKKINKR